MSKEILFDTLGHYEGRELWTNLYRPVLPVTPQGFSLEALLPAILYMMRWGSRRGLGKWETVFKEQAGGELQTITIERAAKLLTGRPDDFVGFDAPAEKAVLGDLLLAYCLENKERKTGRREQIQRVLPAHYLSSWVDLPKTFSHLRSVPEMITAILTQRQSGGGHFELRGGFERNVLLNLFGTGVSVKEKGAASDKKSAQASITSDVFDEQTPVDVDQLLTVRLAQSMGEAPVSDREKAQIPKQLPLATKAADVLFEDLNVFLRAYGKVIPRQSLLPMMESCFSVSLTGIFGATLDLMLHWAKTGEVIPKSQQKPWPLFADCSAAADTSLQRLAEESMDDFFYRMERLPIIFMCLRLLELKVKEEDPRTLPSPEPDATQRIAFLGDLLHDRLEISPDVKSTLRKTCNKLTLALEAEKDFSYSVSLMVSETPPAWRLSETIVAMMGEKAQIAQFRLFADSCMMANAPNGLMRRRKTTFRGKRTERRSLVLTDTVLDYLVHRHLRKEKRNLTEQHLSLRDFITLLRDRYGFYIDEAPPGLSVPADVLRQNRAFLERRLRDLGLFVGVNDAEAMKRLRARFVQTQTDSLEAVQEQGEKNDIAA